MKGRYRRPASLAEGLRRRLRAVARDRAHQDPDHAGSGLRPDRRGRHADLERDPADRHRGGRALHRSITGAGFLRSPQLGNVVNVRASYDQETEAWIQHLTEDLGYRRIAILYQDDSYGRAGLSGVIKAMEKRGMKLVASAN